MINTAAALVAEMAPSDINNSRSTLPSTSTDEGLRIEL